MSVLLVRLRPGIDRTALNFLPVAVGERPGSSAISAGDCSSWHGAQYPPGADRQRQTNSCRVSPAVSSERSVAIEERFGSGDQLETSFPSCASRACSRSQALTARDYWTAFQSPSWNVLEAPQSPQSPFAQAWGFSIRRYPGFGNRSAKPSRSVPALLHGVIVPTSSSKGVSGMTRHPMSLGRRRQQPSPCRMPRGQHHQPNPADFARQLGQRTRNGPVGDTAEKGRQLQETPMTQVPGEQLSLRELARCHEVIQAQFGGYERCHRSPGHEPLPDHAGAGPGREAGQPEQRASSSGWAAMTGACSATKCRGGAARVRH